MTAPPPPFRYTSPEAVIELLAPHGGQGGTAAGLETPLLLAEIAAAEDRIDSALAVRYALPLNPVPDLVRRLARDIAAFLCELTYRGAARIEFGDYDPILMRYQTAEARIRDIVAGKAELGQPLGEDTGSSGGSVGRARNFYPGRLFDPLGRDLERRRPRDPYFDSASGY